MRLPKARPPKRYSRSVETTTRLLHVTAPLSCWQVLAVRLQIQNLVGGPGFEPGALGSRICAVSSTEIDFEGFQFISTTQRSVSSRIQPPKSPGLLHELLHDSSLTRRLAVNRA